MTVECPTCGDEYEKERYMKSHHKQAHDSYVDSNEDLIEDIKTVAEKVGGTPTKSDMKEHTDYSFALFHRRFGCWNDAVKAAGLEVNLHRDISESDLLSELKRLSEELGRTPKRDEMTEMGEFSPKAYSSAFGSWNDALREIGLEVNQIQGATVEVECTTCGTVIKRKKSRVDSVDEVFCSHECRGIAHRGEGSPVWLGGRQNYGPGWNDTKKRKVRIRDQARCQQCGRTEPEHLREHGRKHTVHHIQKARDFDDPEERNAMDNLITLCCTKECHSKWEKMAPLRPIVTESV